MHTNNIIDWYINIQQYDMELRELSHHVFLFKTEKGLSGENVGFVS